MMLNQYARYNWPYTSTILVSSRTEDSDSSMSNILAEFSSIKKL